MQTHVAAAACKRGELACAKNANAHALLRTPAAPHTHTTLAHNSQCDQPPIQGLALLDDIILIQKLL